jgi:UPF0716 protein FxsA
MRSLKGLMIPAVLVLPFVDIYILVQLAGTIGFWQTIGIILLTGLVGMEIIRREGFYVLMKLQNSVTAGEISRNALEIGLLVIGGIILVIPGLITDLIGFLLIFRPIRERIAARLGGDGFNGFQMEVQTFEI